MSQGFVNSQNIALPLAVNQGGTGSTTGVPAAILPTGTLFNYQQTQVTSTTSTTSATFGAISGVTVTITPTSASNTVLIRAVICGSFDNTATSAFLRLVRNSTTIGVGTAAGSRSQVTVCISPSGFTSLSPASIEWLDSPATTSATTYTVEWKTQVAGQAVWLNRTTTDTDAAGFPRGVSVISACEVKV